jgi:sulfonate transport system permease protein
MRQRLLPALLPLLLLGAWQLVSARHWVSSYLLPSPVGIARTLADLAVSGALWQHVGASAGRVGLGFASGAALGLAGGTLVGSSATIAAALETLLQGVRSVPSLAWVPLLILWLGIGEESKITLIAIGAFFPIYLGTAAAVRGVDVKLVELGRAYGLGRAALLRRIVLPAATPALLTGLRTSLTVAWLYVVAAELIAAHSGLGFLLTDGRELSRPDLIFSSILLLASCGAASDAALARLEYRLLRWRPTADLRAAPAR